MPVQFAMRAQYSYMMTGLPLQSFCRSVDALSSLESCPATFVMTLNHFTSTLHIVSLHSYVVNVCVYCANVQYILYIVRMYSIILYIVRMYSIYCILCECTVYTVYCAYVQYVLYIVRMYSIYCILCECTVYTVYCANVQYVLYIVRMYSIYCILCVCTVCTVYSDCMRMKGEGDTHTQTPHMCFNRGSDVDYVSTHSLN